jgi:hypothetical protein
MDLAWAEIHKTGKSSMHKDVHMRNGKALLSKMQAAACSICLFAFCAAPVVAAEQEQTDSGAPAATVMFPVSGDKKVAHGAMQPVVFNHALHEKAVTNCDTCHHTGEPQKCSDCHTLTGSDAGKGITLEQAMHARNITPAAKGLTPSSCVSCHEKVISSKQECMGCHNIVTPKYDAAWCNVCHNAKVTPEEFAKGSNGTLSAKENQALADKAVKAQKPAEKIGFFVPTKVVIGSMADEFQPVLFNHRRHMASVAKNIENDKLAGAFHYNKEVLCSTCHHNSPLSMNPPKCSSCHQNKIDTKNPDRPNLKAAYHLQCMGCHDGMKVARPANTDCTTCHKAADK